MILCKFCRRAYSQEHTGNVCDGCGALLEASETSTTPFHRKPELIVVPSLQKSTSSQKKKHEKEKYFLFRVAVVWGVISVFGVLGNLLLFHMGNVFFFFVCGSFCFLVIKKRSHLIRSRSFLSSCTLGCLLTFLVTPGFVQANPTPVATTFPYIMLTLLIVCFVVSHRVKKHFLHK